MEPVRFNYFLAIFVVSAAIFCPLPSSGQSNQVQSSAFASPAKAAPQVLKGHVPPITKRLTPAGRLRGDSRLDLAIGLPLRNREKLTNLLQELSQPSNPNFRHYLTAEQFASSFAPSPEDYQALADFAKSHGLTVKGTHPNRTLLDVNGTVADIEKAFHFKMQVYQHPVEDRTFFAPDVEPSVDLETPVLAISGLDDYVRPRPQMRLHRQPAAPQVQPLGGGASGGGGGALGATGPGGTYFGYDFRNAYAAGISQTGAGQSVGLFELSGYYPGDLTHFTNESGLTNLPLQNILIDGFDGDDTNADYAVEVTADIEMALSMAPGLSHVYVYEGPTPLYEAPIDTNFVQYAVTTAQINDVLNYMATDNKASQLSCSYLLDINTSTVQIFQQFAAQGQSFFQGSGDSGAYPGAIDSPADDPYLTVVGGTTLSTDVKGAWTGDVVWLTPPGMEDFCGIQISTPEGASGGGVSLTYPIPPWQQGISMTANRGSATMRNLPDVAMVANNINVVWDNDPIYDLYKEFIYDGDDVHEEGTSLATPLWAGFMALVNEKAAAEGRPPVGFANPALYATAKSTNYASCFHDVIQGVNTNADSPANYRATTGYDLCTGWGTMIGSKLMEALLNPPAESLVITPPLGFTSSGPGGGPFTVTSQTFLLTNIGPAPLPWSIVNTTPWLAVSSTSGTLSPGGPGAEVTVSLNSTASNYLIGNYSGNVSILDQADGTAQNRQFDLYVGNGGFETGDFTYWQLGGDTNLNFALAGDDTDVGGTNALPGIPDWLFVHSGLYGAYLGEWDWEGDPLVGSLSQSVSTVPEQQYLISFWLTSVADSDGDTTPSSFSAKWSGSVLFHQTNLPAFGWTNLQYVVPATASTTTLEFDFYNQPAGFGLDDVLVETAPPPVLQSVTLGGGSLTFSWSGSTNLSYQLQSTGSLINPDWINVPAVVTASGNLLSTSKPVNTNASSQQLYRLILMPSP